MDSRDPEFETEPEQLEALRRGLASMGVDAELVVTWDFVNEVRERTGLQRYSADRGAGTVAAKTLGETVLVNAQAVLHRATLEELTRLAAHEAGHVLINRRGESFLIGEELVNSPWEWNVMATAGMCLEEARIERDLARAGYPLAESVTYEHLGDHLFELNAAALETVVALGGEVQRMIENAMTASTRLSTMLAYLSASVIEGQFEFGAESLSTYAFENWMEYVHPTWSRRLAFYQSLPTCREPMSLDGLREVLREGAELEHDSLRSMGFEFRGTAVQWGFWNVATPSIWDARLDRMRAEAACDATIE